MNDRYPNCNLTETIVLLKLFTRYYQVLDDADIEWVLPANYTLDRLKNLCDEVMTSSREYPFDKMNRWLGFVQGILFCNNLLDIDTERDYTRSLFHNLYGRTLNSYDAAQQGE